MRSASYRSVFEDAKLTRTITQPSFPSETKGGVRDFNEKRLHDAPSFPALMEKTLVAHSPRCREEESCSTFLCALELTPRPFCSQEKRGEYVSELEPNEFTTSFLYRWSSFCALYRTCAPGLSRDTQPTSTMLFGKKKGRNLFCRKPQKGTVF